MKLDPRFIEWQKDLWDSLRIGGTWTIPNGGMTIRKIARDMIYIEDHGTNPRMMEIVIAYTEAAGYRVANANPPYAGNGGR